MSSTFQPKNKEWSNVEIVSTTQFKGMRKDYDYLGSVNRGYTNFITTRRNKKTGQCSYIEDTSALTKEAKKKIVRFFSNRANRNKGVAYIVIKRDRNKHRKREKNAESF